MPFMSGGKRNYKKEREWEKENGDKRGKDRATRNNARRAALRDGSAKKGDGTHVDHMKPLSEGGSNAKSNRRVVKASTNLKKEANRKKK